MPDSTIWTFSTSPTLNINQTFNNINFNSNGENYSSLSITPNGIYYGNRLVYGDKLTTPDSVLVENRLSWSPVLGAISYTLFIDGADTQPGIINTYVDLASLNLSSDEHTVQVQAIALEQSSNSSLSSPIAYQPTIWAALPNKGDLISLDIAGTDTSFIILSRTGSIAEVMALDLPIYFGIDPSQEGDQIYDGSHLDLALTTWYSTLPASIKTAAISKTFIQDAWYLTNEGSPVYNTDTAQISKSSTFTASPITRFAYAPSMQDIIDYYEATTTMISANTTLTATNLSTFNGVVLRSAKYPIENYWTLLMISSGIFKGSAQLQHYPNGSSGTTIMVRYHPVMQLDLSKLNYTTVPQT